MVISAVSTPNGCTTSTSCALALGWIAHGGSNAIVFKQNGVTCTTLQTNHLRSMFVGYPEVMLIDAAYWTTVSKYKLFSFMTDYDFGKGQYVQHAVTQNERIETLWTAVETFKSSNSDWTKIQ